MPADSSGAGSAAKDKPPPPPPPQKSPEQSHGDKSKAGDNPPPPRDKPAGSGTKAEQTSSSQSNFDKYMSNPREGSDRAPAPTDKSGDAGSNEPAPPGDKPPGDGGAPPAPDGGGATSAPDGGGPPKDAGESAPGGQPQQGSGGGSNADKPPGEGATGDKPTGDTSSDKSGGDKPSPPTAGEKGNDKPPAGKEGKGQSPGADNASKGKIVVENLPVKKKNDRTGKMETIPTEKRTILPEVKVKGDPKDASVEPKAPDPTQDKPDLLILGGTARSTGRTAHLETDKSGRQRAVIDPTEREVAMGRAIDGFLKVMDKVVDARSMRGIGTGIARWLGVRGARTGAGAAKAGSVAAEGAAAKETGETAKAVAPPTKAPAPKAPAPKPAGGAGGPQPGAPKDPSGGAPPAPKQPATPKPQAGESAGTKPAAAPVPPKTQPRAAKGDGQVGKPPGGSDTPGLRHHGMTRAERAELQQIRTEFKLPATATKSKTRIVGVLVLENGKRIPLHSGRIGGPHGGAQGGGFPRGRGSGFTRHTLTHVEGHAAAVMHQRGIKKATLIIEKMPCKGCDKSTLASGRRRGSPNISAMLPKGSRLTVVDPHSASTYRSTAR
ncbi:MAG: DddA-like double-stranded DNA deaminase toxin [Acidimicrobiales bacterium]